MMINPINGNFSLALSESIKEKDSQAESSSFIDLFKESINKANQLQLGADRVTEEFILGNIDDIHQVTIATEKAQLALNLTIAIQNKVLDAYNEIMRMQI